MNFEIAKTEDIRELYELQLISFVSEAKMIGSRNVPALKETFDEFAADFTNCTVLVKKNECGKIIGSGRYRRAGGLLRWGGLWSIPCTETAELPFHLCRLLKSIRRVRDLSFTPAQKAG